MGETIINLFGLVLSYVDNNKIGDDGFMLLMSKLLLLQKLSLCKYINYLIE